MRQLSWIILSLSIVVFIINTKAPIFFNDSIQAEEISSENIVTNKLSVVQADTLPPYTLADTQNSDQPVVFAPGTISSMDDDAHATFTSDGHTVYFVKSTPQFNHWTTVVSHFKDGHWSTPEVVPFSGQYRTGGVSFSPDGNTLFFVSNRPVEEGVHKEDTDIWKVEKKSEGWSAPQNLGDAVNSVGWEFGPKMSPDGNYLFFTSNRSFFDKPLDRRLSYQELHNKLRGPGNGLRDIYQIDASVLPPPP